MSFLQKMDMSDQQEKWDIIKATVHVAYAKFIVFGSRIPLNFYLIMQAIIWKSVENFLSFVLFPFVGQ